MYVSVYICHTISYFLTSGRGSRKRKPSKKAAETFKKPKTTHQEANGNVSVIRKRIHDIVKCYPKGSDHKCQKCFSAQGDLNDWIGCDQCWRWYHCHCINNYSFDAPFYCNLCTAL